MELLKVAIIGACLESNLGVNTLKWMILLCSNTSPLIIETCKIPQPISRFYPLGKHRLISQSLLKFLLSLNHNSYHICKQLIDISVITFVTSVKGIVKQNWRKSWRKNDWGCKTGKEDNEVNCLKKMIWRVTLKVYWLIQGLF